MSAKYPRVNPEIKWEVPKGHEISNLARTKGGIDPRTTFKHIPEHLKASANKIKHLTGLLEAEIAHYDRELSKCEVSEICRIQSNEREAKENAIQERMAKSKKKILRSYVGAEKAMAKQDGLTTTERRAKAFTHFMQMCMEAGMDIPEQLKENIKTTVEATNKAYGTKF